MSGMEKRTNNSPAKTLALIGIMAAVIECGKLAMAFIPNVEVVSLFIALFSYVFGLAGVLSAVVFVCVEPLIWGFGTWLPAYFIYWPMLALLFLFLGKIKLKNRVVFALVIALTTFFFGILTSLIDVGLLSGFFENFFYRFGVYYARGAVFYIVHIVSNAVIFALLFVPLEKRLAKIKQQMNF